MNGGNVQICRRKRMQDCGNEFFSHPEGTVLLEAEGASEGGDVECDGGRLDHGHVVVYVADEGVECHGVAIGCHHIGNHALHE